ncbi:hypothetical protein STXM2123_4509 [Streptomyces sp. F-3]|nr:hypothetical protein STXM2123_4509 [Streptomyces sp. F-3]
MCASEGQPRAAEVEWMNVRMRAALVARTAIGHTSLSPLG